VLRSSQLDALRLDEELLAMLQEQFSAVFSLFTPVRPTQLLCLLAAACCMPTSSSASLHAHGTPLQQLLQCDMSSS
jgi:hypothetical protein